MNNLTQEEQPNGSSRNDEKNNDSPQWNGRCYARARPKSSRPSPLLPPRRKSPDHAQRYTNEATLSRARSIKFLSTRSVQRRPRCILWWSHDVVPRRAEGGRRKAEHRGAMSRGVHGTHTHTPRIRGSKEHEDALFTTTIIVSPRRKGGAHRRAATVIKPCTLSLSLSIAGGVLMEAEICDLDELTSGQRRASLHSSASLNRCRLEGFVLTVQSFSCGRPLTSRGQVYKPGTPLRGKGDRGEVDRGSRWGFQDLGGTTDSAPQFEYGQGDLSVGFSSFFSDSFSFPVFRPFLRRCSF